VTLDCADAADLNDRIAELLPRGWKAARAQSAAALATTPAS